METKELARSHETAAKWANDSYRNEKRHRASTLLRKEHCLIDCCWCLLNCIHETCLACSYLTLIFGTCRAIELTTMDRIIRSWNSCRYPARYLSKPQAAAWMRRASTRAKHAVRVLRSHERPCMVSRAYTCLLIVFRWNQAREAKHNSKEVIRNHGKSQDLGICLGIVA